MRRHNTKVLDWQCRRSALPLFAEVVMAMGKFLSPVVEEDFIVLEYLLQNDSIFMDEDKWTFT